jgi:predicted PurR-regulated permease PerM
LYEQQSQHRSYSITLAQTSLTHSGGQKERLFMAKAPDQPDTEISSLAEQPPAYSSWKRLGQRIRAITPSQVARFILVVLALIAIGWLLMQTWSSLTPFLIGVVLAYLLLPLVNYLEHWIPRWVSILLVYGAGIIGLIIAIAFIVPPLVNQIVGLGESFPNMDDFGSRVDQFIANYETFIATLPEELRTAIDDGVEQTFAALRDNFLLYIRNIVSLLVSGVIGVFNTFTFVLGFLVLPFWLFYVLNDQKPGVEAFNGLLPSWLRADFWAILTMIDRVFSSYLRGQILLGVIIATVSYVGLTVLQMLGVGGIQYKLLLAVFAGVMELVPYIGPIVGAVPAVLLGLTYSWQSALAIALFYLVVQQIEGNILVPRVVGESVNIHPAILMLLLVMLSQFGIIWIIVSAPLAAIIRDIFQYVYGRFSDPPRPAGRLPRDPVLAPDEPPQQAEQAENLSPETSEG